MDGHTDLSITGRNIDYHSKFPAREQGKAEDSLLIEEEKRKTGKKNQKFF